MRIIISDKAKPLIVIVLISLLLISVTSLSEKFKSMKVMHLITEHEIRCRLLMESFNHIGACSPEDAALIWAEGLKIRSGALQYAVMSSELKESYEKQLEKSSPNWVTGISSPWIDSYRIIMSKEESIELIFSTFTSTGPAGDYRALLKIAKEGKFWRITDISADPGLYPYTLFKAH